MRIRGWVAALITTLMMASTSLPAFAHFAAQTPQFTLQHVIPVSGTQMVQDSAGDLFILTAKGNVVRLSATGQAVQTYSLHATSIAVSSDGSTLYALQGASSSADETVGSSIAIINTQTGSIENTISSSKWQDPVRILLSPGGNTLYVLDTQTERVYAVSTQTGNVIWSINTGIGTYSNVGTDMVLSPDGQTLYVPGYDQIPNFDTTMKFGFAAVTLPLQSSATISIKGSDVVDGIIPASDGSTVYVLNRGTDLYSPSVIAYNTQTDHVLNKWKSKLLSEPMTATLMGNDLMVANKKDIAILDTQSGSVLGVISNHQFRQINALVASPDQSTLYALTTNGLFEYSENVATAQTSNSPVPPSPPAPPSN